MAALPRRETSRNTFESARSGLPPLISELTRSIDGSPSAAHEDSANPEPTSSARTPVPPKLTLQRITKLQPEYGAHSNNASLMQTRISRAATPHKAIGVRVQDSSWG